jgi:hypothetical protein
MFGEIAFIIIIHKRKEKYERKVMFAFDDCMKEGFKIF